MGGGSRIHLLQGGQAVVIGGVRFVGTTLWSDWSLAGRWLTDDMTDRPDDPVAFAAARMTDPVTGSREYRGSIRRADRAAWSPADAMEAHTREKAALLEALARPHEGPTVAVTHHPPSPLAADAFRGHPAYRGGCRPSTPPPCSTTCPTRTARISGSPATSMPATTSGSGAPAGSPTRSKERPFGATSSLRWDDAPLGETR